MESACAMIDQTEEREDVNEEAVILEDRELYQSGMELMNMLILHF